MKRLLLGGMLLAFLLPCHVMAQSAFDGTWKIDVSKVEASKKPEVITLKNGEYTCNCTPPIRIKADGMDHKVSGFHRIDMVSIKIVDDHTVTETGKKDGKVVYTDTTTVAPDGKTATFESTSERPDGSSTVKGTMTRVGKAPAGSHALAGSWHTSSFQSASDNMLTYTYKIDGNSVSMSDPRGESYTATLDGKAAPYKGDPGTDMVSVKMVGHALQETTSLAGKVVSISTMTVSPDGKAMTSKIVNKPSNRSMSLVAMKQ
jgi:hypothetical protein